MLIKFTKMHGLGNDFVVLNLIAQKIRINKSLVKRLADRHFGIGCDQLLIIEPPRSPDVDFHYRIFNNDGSEVQQCGNGVRCFARYVTEKQLTGRSRIIVESLAGRMELELVDKENVRVNMGVPILSPEQVPFVADKQATSYPVNHKDKNYDLSVVSMGNPHGVLFVDRMRDVRVDKLGKALSRHERFPEQANIGFVRVQDANNFDLRVFERGAGETIACGSGACAAFVAGRLRKLLNKTASAHLRGGVLELEWKGEGQPVFMTGPATTVYEGQIRL